MTRTPALKRARGTKYTKQTCTARDEQQLQLEVNITSEGVVGSEHASVSQPKMRGPNHIRESEPIEAKRPEVWPVGRAEFASEPYCSMIVGTIAKLTLRAMPAPLRSFNSWPKKPKQVVTNQFLVPNTQEKILPYINF